MKKLRNLVVGCALAILSFSSMAAVQLQVDANGILTGAKGVDVSGTLYDVSFQDGTCVGLFSGCTSSSNFTFNTQASAIAASTALLDQVFLDGPAGSFDSHPERTNGCSSTDDCLVIIPYSPSPQSEVVEAATFNSKLETADKSGDIFYTLITVDTTNYPGNTWAIWSPSTVSTVPEPGSLLLLAVGFAGLALVRSHRTAREASQV